MSGYKTIGDFFNNFRVSLLLIILLLSKTTTKKVRLSVKLTRIEHPTFQEFIVIYRTLSLVGLFVVTHKLLNIVVVN